MRCAKPRIDFRAAAATFPDILIPKCRHIVKTPISTYSQGILILGAKKEYEKVKIFLARARKTPTVQALNLLSLTSSIGRAVDS